MPLLELVKFILLLFHAFIISLLKANIESISRELWKETEIQLSYRSTEIFSTLCKRLEEMQLFWQNNLYYKKYIGRSTDSL